MKIDRKYRDRIWSQENPRDQLRVIMGAILGDVEGLDQWVRALSTVYPELEAEGPSTKIARLRELLFEASELASRMDPGQFQKKP